MWENLLVNQLSNSLNISVTVGEPVRTSLVEKGKMHWTNFLWGTIQFFFNKGQQTIFFNCFSIPRKVLYSLIKFSLLSLISKYRYRILILWLDQQAMRLHDQQAHSLDSQIGQLWVIFLGGIKSFKLFLFEISLQRLVSSSLSSQYKTKRAILKLQSISFQKEFVN